MTPLAAMPPPGGGPPATGPNPPCGGGPIGGGGPAGSTKQAVEESSATTRRRFTRDLPGVNRATVYREQPVLWCRPRMLGKVVTFAAVVAQLAAPAAGP